MKTTFVGGGNMAAAMIGGMLKAGFAASALRVIELDPQRTRALADAYGVAVHAAPGEWMRDSEVVVLAVKPQQAREACASVKPFIGDALVLSVAAGLRATTMSRWLATNRIVRAMPNTPALVGLGISGAAAMPGATPQARELAERVLRAIGEVVWVDDEALLDPVTAVSGSGPAYVFLFAEAMQQAGRQLGLTAEQARLLALQTFAGAAQQALASEDSLAVLRERVTSKGGTTAAALASMASDQVADAIVRAVQAANRRAGELGDALEEGPAQG